MQTRKHLKKLLAPFTLLAAMCVTPIAAAGNATFEMIPGAWSANDMSPDGRYIVGLLNTGVGYLWDTVLDQLIELPPNPSEDQSYDVVAVSDNGQVVLGNMMSPAAPAWKPTSGPPRAASGPRWARTQRLCPDAAAAARDTS